MKIVRSRRGARLVEGRDVLSHVLARPGSSGGVFDVLAACVAGLAPGPRLAMLGFAGGGVVAPLRAMGFASPIEAVDLSREGEPVFRELSRDWAGIVRLTQAEASAWLRRRTRRYDAILEDLTVWSPQGAVKPSVSLEVLPELVHDRLTHAGIAVVNILPMPGTSWPALLARFAAPYAKTYVVLLPEYENRILVGGDHLLRVRHGAARIRTALRRIRSRQAGRIRLRTLSQRP